MSFSDAIAWRRRQLLRFCAVGLVAAGLQTALLYSFVDIAHVDHLVGLLAAIEITILFQYVVNNAWTFHRSRHTSLRDYLGGLCKTNLVRGTAAPIQVGIFWALFNWVALGYLVANGIAIGLTGIYRYVLDARWTWG